MTSQEDPAADAGIPDPTADLRNRYAVVKQELAAVEAEVSAPAAPALGNGVEPALALKTEAAEKRAQVSRLQRELKAVAEEMRQAMERQMSEMRALMRPMEEKVRQWTEVIQTTNLYLGRDEEIIRLRGGEPAPADTPITIRQMVLSMDEETALHVGDGGDRMGMDHMDIEDFDEWLLADPANLNQVLPEQRGVVALVPRRRGKDYGDPWANDQRNAANLHTYWIIRNGKQVFRMDTQFDVGNNLVPLQDEFTSLFRKRSFDYETRQHVSVDLVPGSREWMQAEEAQGARQRHFMKVALILQGLVDRTNIFHPLPEGGVSLLHPEAYEQGKAVMLADGERSLTANRTPFYTWLRELNAQLRPGMRIIAEFGHEDFRERYDGDPYWYNHRLNPRTASRPESKEIHRIERIEDGDFVILYQRTDEVWSAEKGYTVPKQRASAILRAKDRFMLPIDLVDVPTMQAYLNARTERGAYLDMFPLLKRAIEIKEAEAAAEAPFLEYLGLQLESDLGVERQDIAGLLREVVDWWKLGNKWHRPLVKGADPKAEAKAAAMILKEAKARYAGAANADGDRDERVVSLLKQADPAILFVGRRPNGTYLAFAEQPRKYSAAQGLTDNAFTREYTVSKTGKITGTREWVLPGTRANKTTTLFTAPKWGKWDFLAKANAVLTDADMNAVLAEFTEQALATVKTGYQEYLNHPGKSDPDARLMAVSFDRSDSFFTAHIYSPALMEKLEWDKATFITPQYVRVKAIVAKSAQGGARLVSDGWRGSLRVQEQSPHTANGEFLGARSALLMHDEAPITEFQAALRRAAVHNDARNAMQALTNRYLFKVEQAAVEVALEREKERYLEDYQDLEGWEDHKELVRRRMEPVRIRDKVTFTGSYAHPLALAVKALVESGAALDGQTVSAVMEAAQATPEALEQVRAEGIAGVILNAGA